MGKKTYVGVAWPHIIAVNTAHSLLISENCDAHGLTHTRQQCLRNEMRELGINNDKRDGDEEAGD